MSASRRSGIARIGAERIRQIADEGYSRDDDLLLAESAEEAADVLAQAAAAYALPTRFVLERSAAWPWAGDAYKPKGRLRDLERAGALIAAAIDALTSDVTDPDPDCLYASDERAVGAALIALCDGIEFTVRINGGAGSGCEVWAGSTLTSIAEKQRAPELEAALDRALGESHV